MHLILATQRPAGVVSAEIKSNTNLRIALRVTDAETAPTCSTPATRPRSPSHARVVAYARLGHSSLIPFQSSRVGAAARGEDAGAVVDIRAIAFADLGTPRAPAAQAEEDISVPTDLAAFVAAAREASSASGIVAPPSPWLPAMSEQLTLDEVVADFPAAVPTVDRLVLPFGMVDVPSEQRRDVASYDVVERRPPRRRRRAPRGPLDRAARDRRRDRPLTSARPTSTSTAWTAATTRCCRWSRCPTSARSSPATRPTGWTG